jgi:hypothetical protein
VRLNNKWKFLTKAGEVIDAIPEVGPVAKSPQPFWKDLYEHLLSIAEEVVWGAAVLAAWIAAGLVMLVLLFVVVQLAKWAWYF